jgi:hypothetical protein
MCRGAAVIVWGIKPYAVMTAVIGLGVIPCVVMTDIIELGVLNHV